MICNLCHLSLAEIKQCAIPRSSQNKSRERDPWDVEYDRGKTKKVKRIRGLSEDGNGMAGDTNLFKKAWEERRNGAGGSHPARSLNGRHSGRGRAGGRDSSAGRGRGRGRGRSRGRGRGRGRF